MRRAVTVRIGCLALLLGLALSAVPFYKCVVCKLRVSRSYDIAIYYDGEPPEQDKLEASLLSRSGVVQVALYRFPKYDVAVVVTTQQFCDHPDMLITVSDSAHECGYRVTNVSYYVHEGETLP